MFTPENELGVIVLFSQQAESKGFEIIRIQAAFPDAIVRWKDENYRVEFEYVSSNFDRHGHDAREADLIICWKHDCDNALPVLALSNPNWAEQEIRLPSEIEREVVYWRARAMRVERGLKEAKRKLVEMEDKVENHYTCDRCGRTFDSQRSYAGHRRHCTNNTDDSDSGGNGGSNGRERVTTAAEQLA